MTTERSLFCSEEEFVALKAKAAPLAALLIALPFAAGTKPGPLADALGLAAAIASLSLFALFGLFAAARPEGWSPMDAVETAQAITLWLAALVVVARVA
jgi:hypothetical protein